eukprot:NODE_1719_length_758_cov_8.231379_g1670_i0.p1 GENE.NODE_1719_length_758_cov_8.231379_g1670_i0~~NODE_1719_length_758_cov_8.231379_g1670_i0.p1  ORF type:complete len:178 (-),score=31.70 NODE_1719_length_758_cov_8.231379_g1670_i0:99-632(-)
MTKRDSDSAPEGATATIKKAKIGDKLPSVDVYETEPKNKFPITDLFAGKKGILFGLPGAYTPTCSSVHLPGFVKDHEKLKADGIDVVACVACNDVFVMDAWGQEHNAIGKVHMISDPTGAFNAALGEGFLRPASDKESMRRCNRYSMVIEDNIIKSITMENSDGLECTLSSHFLKKQ